MNENEMAFPKMENRKLVQIDKKNTEKRKYCREREMMQIKRAQLKGAEFPNIS